MNPTTETERTHLQWCKDRALALVDQGNMPEAFSSLASDFGKHESTLPHLETMRLGLKLIIGGHIRTPDQMREWINGFN